MRDSLYGYSDVVKICLTFYENGIQRGDSLVTNWSLASNVMIDYLSESYFYFDENGEFIVDDSIKDIRSSVIEKKDCDDIHILAKFIPEIFSKIKICYFDFDMVFGECYIIRGNIRESESDNNDENVFIIQITYEQEEDNE